MTEYSFSLDDVTFKVDPLNPEATKSPWFDCAHEDVLQARLAAEYLNLGPKVECELWLLKDQFERQPFGPTQHTGWDPLYGEPTIPVRPREDFVVEERWEFEDPLSFNMLIQESESDYVENEKGSQKDRTLTAAVALYDLFAAGLECPGLSGVPGETSDEALLFPDRPRSGDVVYVGGKWNEFFDVELAHRRGYTKGQKVHTWIELELKRRSKYLPRRKDILQGKSDKEFGSLAGTEFCDPQPQPKDISP